MAEADYCRDPEVNVHWADLLREAPGDDALVQLGALRLGLYQMVEAGIIDLDRGARIFEQARQQAIIERRREQQGRQELEL
jgi:hypothetical protein